MSITRLNDTFTLRKEDGLVYERIGRMSATRVVMGERTYTATEALEIALALATAATGAVVRRTQYGKLASFDISCQESVVTLNPADVSSNLGYYSAWAVSDLLMLVGTEGFRGLAGESNEALTRRFTYLTDEQAQEIALHFASLLP